nr:hypothetical protein [Mobilicoccus caccae]
MLAYVPRLRPIREAGTRSAIIVMSSGVVKALAMPCSTRPAKNTPNTGATTHTSAAAA